MSRRQPNDQRSQVSPRPTGGRRTADPDAGQGGGRADRRRTGPHLGPVAITPVRVFLLIALVGGIGFLLYSVLIRDKLQVPLMATGFFICGIVLGVTSLLAVAAVVRAGREGRDGRAVLTALGGGLIAVAAMLCLAAAVIFSMIWSATPGS